MLSRKSTPWVAGLLALSCWTNLASAQTGPGGTNPAPAAPTAPAAAPGTVATVDDLAALLRQLGYEVDVRKDASGEGGCLVTIRKDGFTYVLEVFMNKSRRFMWVVAELGQLDIDHAPPAALVKLLEEDDKYSPAHFSYRRADRRLLLSVVLENREITPEKLNQYVNFLLYVVKETYPTWGNLGAAASTPPAAGNPPANPGTNPPPAGSPTPPAAGQGAWRPYVSAEGRFQVVMPGTPQVKRQTVPAGQVSLEVVIVSSSDPDTHVECGVCYFDLPEQLHNMTTEQLLVARREGIVNAVKGKVVSERQVTLNGQTGLETVIELPNGVTLVIRSFMINHRLYTVMIAGPGLNPAAEAAQAFLNSFNVVQ
jgi:hypothetical protein